MVDYFTTPWHVISSFLVFITGLIISLNIRSYFKCTVKRVLVIYSWHCFFAIIYAIYVMNNGGDAVAYYLKSLDSGFEFSFGTKGVVFFTSILTQFLGLSILGCSLFFQIFGCIGLLAFDAALRCVVINKSNKIKLLATIIVFLPSVSFWSSGVGKDAISFMAVGLALWAALNLNRRLTLMIFAILLMLSVRPHMAGLMVMGLAASFAFQRSIPLVYRFFLGVISLAAVAVLVPFALNYAGVGENVGAEQLEQYIDQRQGYNTQGDGGVDLKSMSFPMQLFTYMFRPLPFEAHSVASFMASLDNVVLLYLSFVGLYYLLKIKLSSELKSHNRAFMWYYLLGSWSVLALTSANLGIAMRQKWMIAPMLIFLLISIIGKNNGSNYES